jgi:hypothetical protein
MKTIMPFSYAHGYKDFYILFLREKRSKPVLVKVSKAICAYWISYGLPRWLYKPPHNDKEI